MHPISEKCMAHTHTQTVLSLSVARTRTRALFPSFLHRSKAERRDKYVLFLVRAFVRSSLSRTPLPILFDRH